MIFYFSKITKTSKINFMKFKTYKEIEIIVLKKKMEIKMS